MDALVEAGRTLFVRHGPDGVSLRDVAREAGVNHGLIHHYIGSRDDLLRLVFDRATEHARQQVEGAAGPAAAVRMLRETGGASDDFARLLAWALLEGRDPAEFHGRSAALDAAAGADDTREVRIALAVAIVQTLGWKLFGGYALTAAGLDPSDADEVRGTLDHLSDRLLA